MSAKAAMSGGSEPGSPGSPGVGREGTAPAGVRASGRAALLAAAYLRHPEGCRMGCFLGSARAELLPKVAEMGFDELQHPLPTGWALLPGAHLPGEELGCFSPHTASSLASLPAAPCLAREQPPALLHLPTQGCSGGAESWSLSQTQGDKASSILG